MKNFWKTLKKPILALAPMEGVTDSVFRQIVAFCGRPSVFFTEFTSCDGMVSDVGRAHVDQRLQITTLEHPIVAQIYGTNPEMFYKTAQMVVDMGFDGIDINMGCPERNLVRKGSCSGLIQNPKLAGEIIQATKEGANGIPVSVKTRIGFNKIIIEEWVQFLLEQKIAALTLHLRTVKEMSKVPAHWDEIAKAVVIRKELNVDTVILGNGDVKSLREADEKVAKYKIDGVMVGRGIFENIWLFNSQREASSITPQEKLALLIKHVQLYHETWKDKKPFPPMRKFVKAYVNGFAFATDLREELMKTDNAEELIRKVRATLSSQLFVGNAS